MRGDHYHIRRTAGESHVVYIEAMPGASERAQRVKIMNANWVAGGDGEDGSFQIMVVTEDGEKHLMSPSPASTATLISMARADTVLVWDPADRTLIAANIVGKMPWTEEVVVAAPASIDTGPTPESGGE